MLFLPGMPKAADEENAVVWRAKSPANDHVLFGYVRIRADSFPDIVAEGKRLVDQSKTVLIDVNPGLTLSTAKFKNSDIKPVLSGLTPSDQDELKTILSTSPAKGAIEKLSGFEASLLLIGEGQHAIGPDAPSIGLALAKYGVSIGRDVKTLVADGEMQAMQKPLTLETVNSVGPDPITYLLAPPDRTDRRLFRRTLQNSKERRDRKPRRGNHRQGHRDAHRSHRCGQVTRAPHRADRKPASRHERFHHPADRALEWSAQHSRRTPLSRSRGGGNRLNRILRSSRCRAHPIK
ncbi:hypothetical protein ACCT19_11645 [Rhizobium ruizarguesonis]